ncbi:MAG: glycerophosphoryl diester phosphodiesterase membrane domain-containing protein, partial [Planctomycetota bacterium]
MIRQLVIAVTRDLRRSLPTLIGFEVLFRIFLVAALAPLTAWALTAIIALRRSVIISNEEIASFLLSPIGALALLLAGTLTLGTLLAQGAGIINIVSWAARDERIGPIRAFLRVVRTLPALLLLALRQMAVFAVLAAPFAVVTAVTAAVLLARHDINYYLHAKPPSFRVAASICGLMAVGALVVAAVLYVRWLFAVPILLYEGAGPRAALRNSHLRLAGSLRRVVAALLGWLAAILILSAVAAGAVLLLEAGLLAVAGDKPSLLIPTIAALLVLEVAIAAVVAFVGVNSHCVLITRLYLDASEAHGVSPLDLATPPRTQRSQRRRARALVWSAAAVLLV